MTDRDLLERAIKNIRPSKWRPLWGKVGALFGLGSASAKELCERLGRNPGEKR